MVVNIPQFPELTFNEFNHTYRLDELIIPSVTTLMKPLSDDVYRTVDPEVLEKAARRGTAIHNAVENFAKFGIEDIPPAYGGYFQAFRTWWELRQPEVLATECRVYHKVLRYAGTADLICVIGGRVTLVDYKSSAQVNTKLCAVQLEGYDRAFESHGVKIDDRLILHLSRDGRYSEVPFQRSTKCWSVLSALMTVRNYMNE